MHLPAGSMKEYVDIARDRVEGMSRQGMGLMVCVLWWGGGGGGDGGGGG